MTVDPWRVAQIAVERGPGHEGSRGSGYLIAPGRVLTAAHVVAGAVAVRVRLDLGKATRIDVQAETWWADPAGHQGTDLAVITIPQAVTAGRPFDQARFGRISDCTAVLKVEAFGFPLFKLRDDPGSTGQGGVFRDFEHAIAHCPVAANRRQGTLAVCLDASPPSGPPEGEPSPWEGMSGGPVLAGSRIVGVVAEHHPSEGTGRLTARRIDRAYEMLSASDLGVLAGLLGLPSASGELPDVVPREPDQLVRSAYLAQVRDIAPDVLIGRDDEVAEWAEFCAGAETYAWWQAGPWAGKSALASWFVLHPPAGADVVSFFITGRLIGQADSDAFLDAMIEQLDSLYPASGRSASVAVARAGAWWDLLALAAADAEQRGRRLVVVVDGLDEDEAGATPPRGRPSIASLLPRRPPSGVRFMVTSRSDPGLPDDLPSDHPLRLCRPHRLTTSRVARDIELRAKQELRDLLSADQVTVDVVGYIAGSGGGLTRSDLSALTGAPPHKLDPVLRGVFGRSLYTRASSDSRSLQADPATRVYLFAHETLRVTAEEQLGSELARYRERVHDWIGSYAASGWPGSTPGYAIRGYPRLLTGTADGTRLCALACNPRRHAFLLDVTGSDYAALSEIGTAQSLLSGQKVPDLKALIGLAAYRLAISLRIYFFPDDLPVVWALLGRFEHAEAIARAIAHPVNRAVVFAGLAAAVAQAGDLSRGEAIARTITVPYQQARALTGLAAAVARAGDLERAEAIARTITYPDRQAEALTSLVIAPGRAGDPGRALRLAADAEAIARTITYPHQQAKALSALAAALAQAGDPHRARRLAADAEAIARTITDPGWQAEALTGLATALAQAGDPDRAEAVARTITYPHQQAEALSALAAALAQAGDPHRARRLAADAEAIAGTITDPIIDPGRQAKALTSLATALAQAGDPDRAEAIARTITDPERQAEALTSLAAALAQAGDPHRAYRLAADAEAITRTITDPDWQAKVFAALAAALARAGDLDRAEVIARTITDPQPHAEALTSLATAAAQAGDPHRARRLAADAETIAHTLTDDYLQAKAFIGLATAAAQAGDPHRARRLAADAEAIARTITHLHMQGGVLTDLVTAVAQAGDLDRAEAIARTITQLDWRAGALATLATAVAQAGDLDRAEAIARTLTSRKLQAGALTGLVTAAAQAGDPHRARRLAADAEAIARTITDPGWQADALTKLAAALAQAGDLDRAARLLATVLVMDMPGILWMETVSRFFPTFIGDACDIFIGMYATPI